MGRIENETLNGVKWHVIQTLLLRPLYFLYSILLARLISPSEIGIFGLTSVFFSIANRLTYCGLGTALIRKSDRTEEDCSTVFWYNVGMSGTLMILLWIASPFFAAYFEIPDLCPLTIISAAMIFLSASASVHYTLYNADRNFKTPILINLAGTIVSLPLTIILAYCGFSYWSLTISDVVATLISVVSIWVVSPWRPRFVFSKTSFREFFTFGLKLTITGAITNLYDGTRNLVIGKLYKPAQLALYNRAFEFCTLPLGQLDKIWKGVALPVLSTIQNDENQLIAVYIKYIRFSSMVIEGGMMALAANAPSIVYCLYGRQWMPCVPYVQILCFAVMFNPITYITENIYIVRNKPDALLRREIIMRTFGIIAILTGAFHSVLAVCYATIISGMADCIISMYMTSRIINISCKEQSKALIPYIVTAMIAATPAYFVNKLEYSPFILAPAGVGLTAVLYYCILKILKDPCLDVFMNLLKEKVLAKAPFFRCFAK